eukprot:jgi/Galph1/5121/GphlegSOOS_G3707.1
MEASGRRGSEEGVQFAGEKKPSVTRDLPVFFRQDFESSQKLLELEQNVVGSEEQDGSKGSISEFDLTQETQKSSSVPTSFQLLSRAALRWLCNDSERRRDRLATQSCTNSNSYLAKPLSLGIFQMLWTLSTARAFDNGTVKSERPARSGVSGTYFLKQNTSSQHVLGVFKPSNEEPGAICSKSEASSSPLQGSWFSTINSCHQSGQCALKEVAAYLLDHGHFVNVPQTVLASCDVDLRQGFDNNSLTEQPLQTKTGAFQVYVPNLGDAEDYGPGIFSVNAVQRLAFFDLRVLNCDRHGGNLLVTRGADENEFNLVPIDHGFILPDCFHSYPWPVWMDWPQVKETVCEDVKRYTEGLDGDMDARLILGETGGSLSKNSLRVLRIMTAILQSGLSKNLTLYEIASLVYVRNPDVEESDFAVIMREAVEASEARNSHIFVENDFSSSVQRIPSSYTHCSSICSDCGDPIFSFDYEGFSESAIGSVGSEEVLPASAPESPSTRYFLHADLSEDDYLIRYAMKLFEEKLEEMAFQKVCNRNDSECLSHRLFRSRSTPDIYRWRPVSVVPSATHPSSETQTCEKKTVDCIGESYLLNEKDIVTLEANQHPMLEKQASRASPCSTIENAISNDKKASVLNVATFGRQSV